MPTDHRDSSRQITTDVVRLVKSTDVTGMAQQIAYSVVFSLAPLLISLTALSGMIARAINGADNPAEPLLRWMTENMPSEAATFLKTPVEHAMSTSGGFLLSFGGVLTLWSARGAVAALMKGLNLVHDVEDDSRGLIARNLTAIAITVALALMIAIGAAVVVMGSSAGETVAESLGIGGAWITASGWLRWPLVALMVIAAVAMVFRFAPNVDAGFRWFLPGAVVTVIGWMVASLLLTVYFRYSGGFSEAYGLFGAVLAFLFWVWVMAVVVLIGGIVNRVVQHDVARARADLVARNDADNANDTALRADTASPGNR